jgi:hypothetical protein
MKMLALSLSNGTNAGAKRDVVPDFDNAPTNLKVVSFVGFSCP